jgi:hypothetical protein
VLDSTQNDSSNLKEINYYIKFMQALKSNGKGYVIS